MLMQMPTIQEWNGFANATLSRAETAKDVIRPIVDYLKANHPNWEKQNDARWGWFTGAKKIIQTSQLSYLFMRDCLTDEEWWKSKGMVYKPEDVPSIVYEYDVSIRWVFLNSLFTITEEGVRRIVWTIDPAACNGAKGEFNSVYVWLLSRLNLKTYEDLFDFYRLIRNTIHNNGVFQPTNGKARNIVFRGVTSYSFVPGKKLDFVKYYLLLEMAADLAEAMKAIILSPEVLNLGYVERIS